MLTSPPLDDLGAFIALIRTQVIAVDRLAAFASEFGSAVELVAQLCDGRTPSPNGQLSLGLLSDEVLRTAQEDVDAWRQAGYDVRTIFDATYPANLREIANRPPFVFVRGQWDDARDSQAIAIVGTRAPSDEGIRRARKLGMALGSAGITVVSGLARGIDSAAHSGALRVGGRTTAVLGTGINKIYPPENQQLANQISSGAGALISQFLPDQPPGKWTFPKRNVVMSGLTWATVVIEASITSGARIQATEALRHGRTVFLLKSLVEEHDWARQYVDNGKFGARAHQLNSIDDLLSALRLEPAIA